jgi:Zn-dependent protease with chaperone function
MPSHGALEAIRPLLPAWTGLADLLVLVPGGLVLGMLSSWIGGRTTIGPFQRSRGASWVERARAAHPVARVAGATALAPAILAGLLAVSVSGPLTVTPTPLLALLAAAATWLGAFAVRRRLVHQMRGGGRSFAGDLHGELTGLLLLLPHLLLVLAMLLLVGAGPDPLDVLWIALAALGFAVASWSAGLPLLRALGWARRAPARFERVVTEVAGRVGVRPRAIWIVDWPCANAFAFPLSRQLLFTEQIGEVLDDAGLAAITAHELGHLSEPWTARLARVAGSFALFPVGVAPLVVGQLGAGMALGLLGGWWVALLVLLRSLRRLEVRADAIGHRHEEDPGAFARALERIHETNLAPAVVGGRNRSHPELYDRMLAAGVEPSYPRPAPPSRLRIALGSGMAFTAFATGMALLVMLPQLCGMLTRDPERRVLWSVALSGGRRDLLELAGWRAATAGSEQGIALARAAGAADPRDHHAPAYAATLLADDGRCDEASAALRGAESRTASTRQRERCGWIAQAREAVGRCRPLASPAGL